MADGPDHSYKVGTGLHNSIPMLANYYKIQSLSLIHELAFLEQLQGFAGWLSTLKLKL